MTKFMRVQLAILKRVCGGDKAEACDIVLKKGAYIRQLAHGVINGNYSEDTAVRLLRGYDA